MTWAEFAKGVEAAASAWNYVQAAMSFGRVTRSPDTLIKGYWNKTGGGSHNDPCPASVACTYARTSTYPHLDNNEPVYVEFPPQFPRDSAPKQWTNDWNDAYRYPDDFYYLPQVMMHELGHTAGLGHSHWDNAYSVMGDVDSDFVLSLPSGYDANGMKHNYQGHTKHN